MILNPASRKKRIFAATVDIAIISVIYFFVVVMFGDKKEDASDTVKFVLSGLPALLLFIGIWGYFVIPEIISGQTLGKSLFDIKVVSVNGDDIDIKQSTFAIFVILLILLPLHSLCLSSLQGITIKNKEWVICWQKQ